MEGAELLCLTLAVEMVVYLPPMVEMVVSPMTHPRQLPESTLQVMKQKLSTDKITIER